MRFIIVVLSFVALLSVVFMVGWVNGFEYHKHHEVPPPPCPEATTVMPCTSGAAESEINHECGSYLPYSSVGSMLWESQDVACGDNELCPWPPKDKSCLEKYSIEHADGTCTHPKKINLHAR